MMIAFSWALFSTSRQMEIAGFVGFGSRRRQWLFPVFIRYRCLRSDLRLPLFLVSSGTSSKQLDNERNADANRLRLHAD